jgi:hypothetical protein
MTSNTPKPTLAQPVDGISSPLFDDWFDPIESVMRDRVRGLIEELIRDELDAMLGRPRYGRVGAEVSDGRPTACGYRHGSRTRTLTGSFGKTGIAVPRARLQAADGGTTEWKSKALRAYQRRTIAADALIAGVYLAGTNTRRVRRALASLFGGAVSKDIVSRTWRKVKSDWDGWNARPQGLHPQMAAQAPGCRRQPRGGRRALVRLRPPAAVPVEERPHHQRHRAPARGVQATDQDPDRPALRRDRRHAVLGAARLRPDQHAQSRRLAHPHKQARPSAD